MTEPLAAYQMHGRFGAPNGTHRKEPEGTRTVGQVFAFQERGRSSLLRDRLGIAEARRPLCRADHIAIRPDNLQEVQLSILRERLSFGEKGRGVAGLRDFRGDTSYVVGGGQPVHRSGNLGRAILELALKLADEERGFLAIALLEDMANAQQHGPGDGRNSRCYRQRKEQEQTLPKAHGASSTEASARSGMPSAIKWRSRTRGPNAYAWGRSTSGMRVCWSRKARSAL